MQGGRNQNQDQFSIPSTAAVGAHLGGEDALLSGALVVLIVAAIIAAVFVIVEKKGIYLELAYRTTEAEIIKSIPRNKPLDRDSCKKLFKACKYMRTCKYMREISYPRDTVNTNTAKRGDEYAFHVITLKVSEDIPGLDRGVDTLKRLDGFLQLAGKAEIVKISGPLPPSFLEGKGFYKVA